LSDAYFSGIVFLRLNSDGVIGQTIVNLSFSLEHLALLGDLGLLSWLLRYSLGVRNFSSGLVHALVKPVVDQGVVHVSSLFFFKIFSEPLLRLGLNMLDDSSTS